MFSQKHTIEFDIANVIAIVIVIAIIIAIVTEIGICNCNYKIVIKYLFYRAL